MYGLVESRIDHPRFGLIRYIGKSEKCVHARQHHRAEKAERYDRRTPVDLWLRKLLRFGLSPSIVVLEEIHDNELAKSREIGWIAYHRLLGFAELNVTDGGDGFGVETSVKASLRSALKALRGETSQNKSAAMTRYWATLSPKERSARQRKSPEYVKKPKRRETYAAPAPVTRAKARLSESEWRAYFIRLLLRTMQVPLTRERRSLAMRRGWEKLTPEQRFDRAAKTAAGKTSEQKTAAGFKGGKAAGKLAVETGQLAQAREILHKKQGVLRACSDC